MIARIVVAYCPCAFCISCLPTTFDFSVCLAGDSPDTSNVVLALHTLGSFDFSGESCCIFMCGICGIFILLRILSLCPARSMFNLRLFFSGHSLTQFVRHCANVFLVSEYVSVRIEAVRTCARLLMPTLTVS